jgi:DNA-binding CsgD family transcriptional regulator
VEAASAELGITVLTARTHLKRVFAKTKTRRQSELVLLLLNAAPPLHDE